MSAASEILIAELRSALAEAGCAANAGPMQRYMKSAMPYYGVQMGPVRKLSRQVFARHTLRSFEEFRDTVWTLYRDAQFREERYAAIELARLPRHAVHRTLRALPLFEQMIRQGAWWDLVDGIAAHLIGELLRKHPAQMKPSLLRWAKGRNIWKRRSAILSQLGFKENTDVGFLFACIEPSLGSEEFFLRKAIGWALRQYAWTDPAAVRAYVRAQASRLSPLSRREALKNVGANRRASRMA